jgi:hypothetical protein
MQRKCIEQEQETDEQLFVAEYGQQAVRFFCTAKLWISTDNYIPNLQARLFFYLACSPDQTFPFLVLKPPITRSLK